MALTVSFHLDGVAKPGGSRSINLSERGSSQISLSPVIEMSPSLCFLLSRLASSAIDCRSGGVAVRWRYRESPMTTVSIATISVVMTSDRLSVSIVVATRK